ncbi:hypothetical protein RQP46_008829 [Phenoliferia psychrophenolica]
MNAPTVGQTYETLDEAKIAFTAQAAAEGADFSVAKRDKTRMTLKCKNAEEMSCGFQASVRKQQDGTFKVVSLQSAHRCHGHGGSKKRSATSGHDFVVAKARELLVVNAKTVPKTIMDAFKHKGIDIEYHAAWRAKVEICGESVSQQALQFAQIPDYLNRILAEDPKAICKYTVCEGTETFTGAFISTSAQQTAWVNSRAFVAVDGAHTKSTHDYILTLAAGYDGNDKLVIYAFGFALRESTATWEWFLERLKEALVDLDTSTTTIVSDRQKGLLAAIKSVLPNTTEVYCCVHLLRNFQARKDVGKADSAPLFWACAQANSEEAYRVAIGVVSERFGRAAADYLWSIPAHLWVFFAISNPLYGRSSSNIVEIGNAVFTNARALPPLDLLAHIYEYEMGKFAERRTAALAREEVFTEAATAVFNAQCNASRSYTVTLSSSTSPNYAALVRHPLARSEAHTVEIWVRVDEEDDDRTDLPSVGYFCSCGFSDEHRIPCRHTIALAGKVNVAPHRLVESQWLTETLRWAYRKPMRAISTADLEISLNVGPPSQKRGKGRPQTLRMEQGEMAAKDQSKDAKERRKCGICKGPHIRSKCPDGPA